MDTKLIEKSIVVTATTARVHAALTRCDDRRGLVPAVTMSRESDQGWPRLYLWVATGPAVREIELYVTEPVPGAVILESSWSPRVERRYSLQAIDGGRRTRVTSRLTLRLADHDAGLAAPLRTLQASELIGLAALARSVPAGPAPCARAALVG